MQLALNLIRQKITNILNVWHDLWHRFFFFWLLIDEMLFSNVKSCFEYRNGYFYFIYYILQSMKFMQTWKANSEKMVNRSFVHIINNLSIGLQRPFSFLSSIDIVSYRSIQSKNIAFLLRLFAFVCYYNHLLASQIFSFRHSEFWVSFFSISINNFVSEKIDFSFRSCWG